ncbi:GTP-binding protein [Clostridium sp.]|uniref:GTP-binding protein n=1 Tax=Clostridium sp. TaxID=1506 RepID=UPI002FCC1482
MMKSDVEIVTGFIGSGKTTFINALLEDTLVKGERVVILQFESGETEIEKDLQNDERVTLLDVNYEELIENNFSAILQRSNPHRIIIEFNGTKEIQKLLDLIHSKHLKSHCKLTTTYYLSEGATFHMYLNNMGRFLLPCVEISNLIILNNTEDISKDILKSIEKTLNQQNRFIPILEVKEHSDMKQVLKDSNLFHKGFLKKCDLLLKDFLNSPQTYQKEKNSGK